jgi:hypothetical protein
MKKIEVLKSGIKKSDVLGMTDCKPGTRIGK